MKPCPFILLGAAVLMLAACDRFPGQPNLSEKWRPASEIADFATLYSQNCLGCHGDGRTIAGSLTLKDPLYLSVIPEPVLRNVIANGIPRTAMPGFSPGVGGPLTEKQIDILVQGILAWKANPPPSGPLPPYSGPLGNVASGAQVYSAFCASCHGQTGSGGKAGSVINPAYLDLVSDQYLRTIVIAGRSDLGCPDFMSRLPGRAMTNEEIADVTAWLVSHRRNEFGQPLGTPQP